MLMLRIAVLFGLLETTRAESCLTLTGIIDGPLPGGLPKAAELFATCPVADASVYGIGVVSNGNGDSGQDFALPSVAIAAGEYFYISTSSDTASPSRFEQFLGFAADYGGGSISVNGNDSLELWQSGSVVDVFGNIAVDGTNQAWEYLDGWAYRVSGTGPDGATFVPTNWLYSGANALDGETTNAAAVIPFPLGTYSSGADAPASPSPPSIPPSPPLECTPITELQYLASLNSFGSVYLACGWVTRVVYNGFFMQEEKIDPDDSIYSSGIFVYMGTTSAGVVNGDAVEVKAALGQYGNLHQLTSSPIVTKTGAAERFFDPVELTLPVSNVAKLEALQSMLVSVQAGSGNTVVVSEYYNLDRYGEFVACASNDDDGRLYQFTARNAPDETDYAAHVVDLNSKCLTIDDNLSTQNPNPVKAGSVYPIDTASTLRGGSEVTTLIGPLYVNTGFGPYYRVQPESTADLVINQATNLRAATPPSGRVGELRIASSNLLNYFLSVGTGSQFRGANSEAEFGRQVQKTLKALTTMNADIYCVVELENLAGNGAAIDLVDRLNTASPSRAYTAVSIEAGYDTIGADAIKVDVLYDTNKLELVGHAILVDAGVNSSLLSQSVSGIIFDGLSRVPLAATFRSISSGRALTVVVNHFKSKGGTGTGGDADQNNGAGSFNLVRTLSSKAVLEWLDGTPTGVTTDNILIVGDLNAYEMETPIATLTSSGYSDVTEDYSYLFSGQFGSLDYVFAKNGMNVRSASTWHVNADEPDLIDYNLNFGRSPALFDGSVPYRFSDHDPVIVELNLSPPPTQLQAVLQGLQTLIESIFFCF